MCIRDRGITYAFTPELNTYAGYNEGNRAPSPIETGCADPAFPCLLPNAMAGDPPLKQVVAKTFEGGFRGKFGNDIRWTAGAYRTTNYNDLQFIASGTTGAGYFDNVGKTRRQGLDFGLNGTTGDFNWSAGYSFIEAVSYTHLDVYKRQIVTDLAKLRGKVKGVLLGVGGDTLQPIPRLNQKDEIIGYWKREDAVLEGNHPNLLPMVRNLAPSEKAPDGTLDEVTEHISSFNKTFMQALSQASGFELVRINTPADAVNALKNSDYQKQAMAERDARWIFSLVAAVFILIGWFWQRCV